MFWLGRDADGATIVVTGIGRKMARLNAFVSPLCDFFLCLFESMTSIFSAQSQYNSQRAGITTAIVLAVLVPLGLLGFYIVVKLRQNAQESNY